MASSKAKAVQSCDIVRKIVGAARSEFACQGLKGARMCFIAQKAGVTRQIIYYYFGSKQALYEAVLEEAADQCATEIGQIDYASLDPMRALLLFFGTIFDQHCHMPELLPLTLDSNFNGQPVRRSKVEATMAIFDDIIDAGIAAAIFRRDLDRRLCFAMALSLTTGCFIRRVGVAICAGFDYSDRAFQQMWKQHMLDVVANYLATPRWVELHQPRSMTVAARSWPVVIDPAMIARSVA